MVKKSRTKQSTDGAKQDKVGSLSALESEVMQVVWDLGAAKAEEIRLALESTHDLKDSTIRTLLRRLENKGVLEHSLKGRAFVYRPKVQAGSFAAKAVRGIADRFCRGSISSLLLGMAGDDLVSAEELRKLADKIEQSKQNKKKTSRKKSESKKKKD